MHQHFAANHYSYTRRVCVCFRMQAAQCFFEKQRVCDRVYYKNYRIIVILLPWAEAEDLIAPLVAERLIFS